VRAVLLAAACFVSTGLGVLMTPVPVLGSVFAFGAPVLALVGVIVGGLDIARARREGKPRDAALVGTVLAGLGFFPALLTALSCGVCNALVSSGPIRLQRDLHLSGSPTQAADAGATAPGLQPPPLTLPGQPPAAGQGAPPPGLPPPPLPSGPGQGPSQP